MMLCCVSQVKELIVSVKGDENGITLDQFKEMLMVSDDRADLVMATRLLPLGVLTASSSLGSILRSS